MKILYFFLGGIFFIPACKKNSGPATPEPPATALVLKDLLAGGKALGRPAYGLAPNTIFTMRFSAPVDKTSVAEGIVIADSKKTTVPVQFSFLQEDSVVVVRPVKDLNFISAYSISLTPALHSTAGTALAAAAGNDFVTALDSSAKFPALSNDDLLTLVQKQTFKYFYDFGHPVSGMARERNSSGDVVSTGGTGFGIMSMIVGASRGFISRGDAAARVLLIADFLSNTAHRYHGAFPHWINGATGATVPFSDQDDGADLVETSYLMEGLLCARQYFNNNNSDTALRNRINALWGGIEWQWFRQGNQNELYWHWSPDKGWAINQPVSGWNEALIVYALAASAPSNPIPKGVYDNGWARNGSIKNGATYFDVVLPLGEPLGGPLFFEHYSFMGINPVGLTDDYADYGAQTVAHSQINYKYCVGNPQSFNGYSESCWGLTASDDNISGYSAHSPTADPGIISPTAAISSLPYTPVESMQALKFFYYVLGDKLWGDYGFKDAFNLSNPWFADSYLAIDQGPEIVMIENYRSGLMWNLFMSCPEIKAGMKSLGFQSTALD